jgi:hypothetical protein
MDFLFKVLRIGDRVRIMAGGLKGLTGIIRRFGSSGSPVLAVDGLFEVMVGLKNVRLSTLTVDARRLN